MATAEIAQVRPNQVEIHHPWESRMPSNQTRKPSTHDSAFFCQKFVVFTLLAALSPFWELPASAEVELNAELNLAQASSSAELNSAYTLGIGDRVQLDVFGVEKYTGSYLVLTDGTMNLPAIGLVRVEGLTLSQAQAIISQRYSALLKQPVVTLNLLGLRSIQVAVSGEVARPGSYNFDRQRRGGNNNNDDGGGNTGDSQFPRLSEAIRQAGGITQAADIRQVQLRRTGSSGSVITLDLEELIQQGSLSQDPILLDGDSIFIPTALDIQTDQIRQLVDTNLSSGEAEPLQVAIVGEVFRPGVYSVIGVNDTSDPPTVTQAIKQAGGITELADIRNIEVRRITRTGQQETQVNLWELLQSGDISQDPFLQEGDTIIVPTATAINPAEVEDLATASFSPDTIRVNVVGEVVQPGILEVPPNTTMNQAIMAAGGFDQIRAEEDTVELIRLNPDGTATRREIDVNLAQGVDEAGNPLLKNNDIIVIDRSGFTRIVDTTNQVSSPARDFVSVLAIFQVFFGN
ncbi:MAG: SLBB domain-containing protein [Microcoleaceae cyanobacterium]